MNKDGIKEVQNVDAYCESMAKGVADKVWFTHHVPATSYIVDVGCADGAVLNATGMEGVGYDPYLPCLDRGARLYPHLTLTSSRNTLASYVEEHRDNSVSPVVLVLGTVLHEAYHNKVDDQVFEIIDDVKPDFIAVRDMGLLDHEFTLSVPNEDWDAIDQWIAEHEERPKVIEFKRHIAMYYGHCRMGMLKTCLTAKHIDSRVEWDENYFACAPQGLIERLADHAYGVNYFGRHTPRFLRDWVRKEIGVDLLPYTTHFTLLVERYSRG